MVMSLTTVILTFSIIIQLITAIYALLLIRLTGFKYSWVFISIALILMSVRRIIPLYKILFQLNYFIDMPNEILGLLLSVVMLIGIRGIKTVFIDRNIAEEARRNSEAKSQMFFDRSIVGMVLVGLDKRFIDCNEAFSRFTGFSKEEILGRTISSITYDEDLAIGDVEMKKLLEGKIESSTFEKRYIHKSGSMIWGEINICLLNTLVNQSPYFLATIVDITERKNSDSSVKTLLAEKMLILKEVHHRIKNNMNTVSSLLSLQAQTVSEPSAVSVLLDARGKVQSMGLLYDKLYKASDFTNLSVKEYLPALVDEVIANFPNANNVKVEIFADDFVLDAKRLQPLGLIINELLTNIMKYAFHGREAGLITVSAANVAGHVSISVQDDGIGMPESVSLENSSGFGLQLVHALTQQLKGTTRIERNSGTKIELEFDE
jgi:PAS domain S-box-containing protein